MDTKDIMLKIVGKQIDRNHGENELIEFFTEGKLYKRNNALYLAYNEGDGNGGEGMKTMVKIKDDQVRLKKYGGGIALDTLIEFNVGKRYQGFYSTPFGSLEMEVLTNSITNTIDAESGSGKLDIDYHMCLKGLTDARTRLNIEIM